jgi:DNA polymerase III subunit gamma/tau
MVEQVQPVQPVPSGRRLLVRLCLFAFCGGLLLLLSSRPAEAAERREPGLLDPVSTTLEATAREVLLAGRATGSGASTVGKAAGAARPAVAPQPRPATGAARPAAPAVKRGTPAVTSPFRRVAPPTRPATTALRTAARSTGAAAKPVPGTLTGPLDRVAKVTAGPVARVAEVASPVAGVVAPVAGAVVRPLGPALAPVGSALAPVGSALAPVGSALAPIAGAVGGLVGPVVPGGLLPLPGSGTGSQAGPGAQGPASSTGVDATAPAATAPAASVTNPARPAADGASSPAARSTRSRPALTGAVSLPGFPTSAELPAGGPDPLSTTSGAGFALAAFTAALLLLGLSGRGRARPDRSGVISRSYLPAVSPA